MRIDNPFVNLHPAEIPLEEYESKFAIKTKRRLIMPNLKKPNLKKQEYYQAICLIDEIVSWAMDINYDYIEEIECDRGMSCDKATRILYDAYLEMRDD